MKKINYIDSVKHPIITEKATVLSEQNKTVFKVHKSANKNIGVRINNIELKDPCMRNGWVLFNLDPTYLAVGENLVGVHLLNSKVKKNRLLEIEKLEIHVVYKKLV